MLNPEERKNEKMKKICIFLLTINFLLISNMIVNAEMNTNVLLNGKTVVYNDDTGYPFVDENNRTLVPLRATMESAGFVVGYDNNAQTAIIITEHDRIEVPIGTNKVYVNNTLKLNDTDAVIKNSRTYLPIRIILESAQYTVEWDENTKSVNAYTYNYNEEDFVPYHTTNKTTLIEKVLSGQVVYVNGEYYATPEYVKLSNNVQVHYWNDDLNIAIYPQTNRYEMSDFNIPSFSNESDDVDGITNAN